MPKDPSDDYRDRLIAWATENAPEGAEWSIPHYSLSQILGLKDLDLQLTEGYVERIQLADLARANARAELIAEGMATGKWAVGYETPEEQDGAVALAAWRAFDEFNSAEGPSK